MEKEAAMPGSAPDPEAITLAELDGYMGVIHDSNR